MKKICKIKIFTSCFIGILIIACLYFHKTPVISVVMSTYNRADLLPRSVESILNQTYKDFEFIIINDGSTDNTADVLQKYARQDKRIKILTHEKNQGIVAAVNDGLKAAKGKYIARMDDDDLALAVRFEKQLNFMEQNPDITVVGTKHTKKIDFNELSNRQLEQYQQKALIPYQRQKFDTSDRAILSYFTVPVSNPSAFIRASFLKKHHILYQSQYDNAEDLKFWYDIVQHGGKIVRFPHPLVLLGKSPKKSGYKREQRQKKALFLQQNFPDIFTGKEQNVLSRRQECFLLMLMEERIGEKDFLTPEALDHVQKLYKCPTDELVFRHKKWTDTMKITGEKTIQRHNNDTATFQYHDGKYILTWDNFPDQEIFECLTPHLCKCVFPTSCKNEKSSFEK